MLLIRKIYLQTTSSVTEISAWNASSNAPGPFTIASKFFLLLDGMVPTTSSFTIPPQMPPGGKVSEVGSGGLYRASSEEVVE